ncbi:MAG: hypothetical protein RI996_331 [Candidatus Parcubacteria bacterium]|jgi:hypothetical protein
MLYIITGDDRRTQKKYIQNTWGATEATLLFLDQDNFTQDSFEQTLFGSGLFGETYVLVLDGICENAAERNYILSNASEIANRDTIVVLIEKKIDVDFLKEIEKYCKGVQSFKLPETRTDFTLWSAIYARNKKSAWMSFVEQAETESVERIHATMLGQFKNMYKIKAYGTSKTYKELDFEKESSFVSAQKGAALYSLEEIEYCFYTLTKMPLLAHNGETDLGLSIEKFLLENL